MTLNEFDPETFTIDHDFFCVAYFVPLMGKSLPAFLPLPSMVSLFLPIQEEKIQGVTPSSSLLRPSLAAPILYADAKDVQKEQQDYFSCYFFDKKRN